MILRMVCRSLLLATAVALPAQVNAQGCLWPGPPATLSDRASPPDSAMLTIGGMGVKVCYSRPSVRGRVVFGELVPFDEVWRTGANEPTLLHLPFAARVAGMEVPAGEYLVFTVPGPDEWTVQLHTSDAEVPNEMFGDNVEVGRGTVRAEPLDEHVETFTIRGVSGETEGAFVLEWERTRVRIPVERLAGDAP